MKTTRPRTGRAMLPLLVFIAMSLLLWPASSRAEETQQDAIARHVPGELIVKLKSKTAPLEIPAIREALDLAPEGGTRRMFAGLPAARQILDRFPQRTSRIPLRKRDRAEASLARLDNVHVIEFGDRTDLAELLDKLNSSPDVEYAEPNYIATTLMAFLPDDPFFSSSGSWGQPYDDLWGLKKIQAELGWDLARGAGILVAVSDTGVDYNHVELQGRMWINAGEDLDGDGVVDGDPIDCTQVPPPPPNGDYDCVDSDSNGFVDDVRGWDNLEEDPDPFDLHGHGTHVSGTIAATGNNGIGIIGVAFEATIMPVRFLGQGGSGSFEDGAESVLYAAANGADVINMSWGGGFSQVTYDALTAAHDLGVVLVAGAGNYSTDLGGFFPAAHPDVMAVAALDHLDVPADFSNWGEGLSVSAPGGDSADPEDPNETHNNILSLKASGTPTMGRELLTVDEIYYRARGTSMASPHAAGVAALALARQPGMTNDLARVVVETSADDLGDPGFDTAYGHGRVNAFAAAALADVAVTRAELIAGLSADSTAAAPNSPVEAIAQVINAGPVAASNVGLQLFDGDPDGGGTLLRAWTVSTIAAESTHEEATVVSLPAVGEATLYLVVDPQDAIAETSEDNNTASTGVNVGPYQWIGSVVANDDGLIPPNVFVIQKSASISGDRVVWLDNRDATGPSDPTSEIYMEDLSTGVVTRITNTPASKSDPYISGDRIVWIDRRNGESDVYLYDLSTSTETQITFDTYSRSAPRVDGDHIVWSDMRNGNFDVFLYEISTGGPEVALTSGPGSEAAAAVSDGYAVWADYTGGANAIYGHDIATGVTTLLADGFPAMFNPDVRNGSVVWSEGYINSAQDMDLAIQLLDLGQPPAVEVARSPLGAFTPTVSDSDIAWVIGLYFGDVHVMDRESGISTRLTSTGHASLPRTDGARVVWEDYLRTAPLTHKDYDVFMSERDAFPAAPANLVATRAGRTSIDLNWSDNSEPDLAGYTIYRRASLSKPFVRIAMTTASAYTDTGLVQGRRYYYRVCAIDDADGESSYSNEDSAVPGPIPICRDCPDPYQEP